MAGREYVGAGGLRLFLDEPYSPQMEEQIRKGHLVPVPDETPEDEPVDEGTQAPDDSGVTELPADDGGDEQPSDNQVKRPTANSKVDDWRAYAVSLGMSEDSAQTSTKAELTEWVEVAENAQAAGE